MAFQNRTNEGRAEKIVEILDLIEKSATSNKASALDVGGLLSEVNERLHRIADFAGAQVVTPDHPQEERKGGDGTYGWPKQRVPNWADIREAAERAPLKDLSVALAVYMNRVDEEIARASERTN